MSQPEVISLGCRLNAYEGEAMRRLAGDAGLAGAVVVNSCAVTNEAVRQTRQAIRRARRADPSARIVVTGCAAQIDPDAFARMGEVDAVLGNREKLEPAAWRDLSRAFAAGERPVRVDDIMAARETAGHLVDGYGDRARAFLEVQNGCDHRCTFCVIPYGRGNSRSVPLAAVVEEARRLAAAGRREIVLTGVDLTAYGADLPERPGLGDLVGAILDGVPSLHRLRLSSIDCAEVDATLFERIVADARLAPHLHLSLQAGDDMILKRMKRRHARSQAIEFCARVREKRPEVAFGADLIAGFPTETEEMFENTLRMVEEAGLCYLHVFPFSPRAGTPAARMPQLDRATVKARAERLREKGRVMLHRFLDGLVGRVETAVVESGGRARLGNFAPVKLAAPAGAPGDLARLRLLARAGEALLGAAA
ncbi:tRNA (N(6)-L-threonylcarbamoyladenosine(37)-C(2))-methylthiotransferase MtaB [Amphiplicatus metriothermophilus]|uniref:Threonylcarbamoyladenosine tRNA methylthiotransferase MtaB n=1 Tax=Amphiplicatus metriothermophilus TaxID=1519374 RepID=A0A239PJH2_9PROT|nr:tRNA (N(6)-L-threonylcarbamoyladenosine(37)-C(2))-methylthiotransferase MtaB [Amphiplicatus metriothermophilus]MBB5517705.1 threonylcarbamoyladenosine tRNA methylthiotransferase MtaB [Amphiplicatus metriothermophilus]SNT67961.1 threonylcarbamoyladenosine tRNA methylthiotransferase MtaB [Amphiplicatus metriothermophilus]